MESPSQYLDNAMEYIISPSTIPIGVITQKKSQQQVALQEEEEMKEDKLLKKGKKSHREIREEEEMKDRSIRTQLYMEKAWDKSTREQ